MPRFADSDAGADKSAFGSCTETQRHVYDAMADVNDDIIIWWCEWCGRKLHTSYSPDETVSIN